MSVTEFQTRRQHLARLALPLASRLLGAAGQPRVFGVQLASIRRALKADAAKALRDLAAIGYREVEVASRADLAALAPLLKQAGLTIRACQTETPLITRDWELYPDFKQITIEQTIDTLKSAGAEYFLMGDISAGARGDGDDFYRRTADRMNAAAELCRRGGLKFVWPIQGFAFQGRPGLRALDIFRERLDAKLAPMELDTFRISLAGYKPEELLRDWKGRVAIVRLLDKPKTAPRLSDDLVLPGTMADPGDGSLDFAVILKVAQQTGVRTLVVAQAPVEDETADQLGGLKKSFGYLGKLG